MLAFILFFPFFFPFLMPKPYFFMHWYECTHTHTHTRDARTLFSTTSSFDKPLSKPHRISISTYLYTQPHIISMSITSSFFSILSLSQIHGRFFLYGSRHNMLLLSHRFNTLVFKTHSHTHTQHFVSRTFATTYLLFVIIVLLQSPPPIPS